MSGPASFRERLAQDRRLAILLLLDASPGARAGEPLLRAALAEYGHEPSLDALRSDLDWLAEIGLVELETQPLLRVATLLARGEDVAKGRALVSGVSRPTRR